MKSFKNMEHEIMAFQQLEFKDSVKKQHLMIKRQPQIQFHRCLQIISFNQSTACKLMVSRNVSI